jgi:hypothetical protein
MIYIPIAVALVCFILYALDRRAKSEPIDWVTAGKFTLFGGAIAGGIVYVLKTETVDIVLKELPEVPVTQEMFVGVPTF